MAAGTPQHSKSTRRAPSSTAPCPEAIGKHLGSWHCWGGEDTEQALNCLQRSFSTLYVILKEMVLMLFLTAYNSAERTEVNESKMMGFFRNEILLNEHCLIAQPHLTLNAVETENLIKKSVHYSTHCIIKKKTPTRNNLEQNILSQHQSKFTSSSKEVIRNKTEALIFTRTMENVRTLTKTSNLHSLRKKILVN